MRSPILCPCCCRAYTRQPRLNWSDGIFLSSRANRKPHFFRWIPKPPLATQFSSTLQPPPHPIFFKITVNHPLAFSYLRQKPSSSLVSRQYAATLLPQGALPRSPYHFSPACSRLYFNRIASLSLHYQHHRVKTPSPSNHQLLLVNIFLSSL